MFCSNCGKEMDIKDKFCKSCGEKNIKAETNVRSVQKTISKKNERNPACVFVACILTLIFMVLNFTPILKVESYSKTDYYSIFRFAKEKLYDQYSLNYYGTQNGENVYLQWNKEGEQVSIFDYMYERQYHGATYKGYGPVALTLEKENLGIMNTDVSEQSGRDIDSSQKKHESEKDNDIELTPDTHQLGNYNTISFLFSLLFTVTNILFSIVCLITLVKDSNLPGIYVRFMSIIEVLRVALVLFNMNKLISIVPDVFLDEDVRFLYGSYTPVVTIVPFYFGTFFVLGLLAIFYGIYFRRTKRHA